VGAVISPNRGRIGVPPSMIQWLVMLAAMSVVRS